MTPSDAGAATDPPTGPLARNPGAADQRARPLARLWHYTGAHRVKVWLAILFASLNKLFDVVPELLIGAAVDVVVQGDQSLVGRVFDTDDRRRQLVILAVVNLVVWILESTTEFVANLLWRNLAQTIEHEARMDAYAHIQRLELAYFEDRSTGGLLSVLNDDVNQLERFLDVGAMDIIRTGLNVVFVGIVFFATSWQLALFAFVPIPIIVLGSVRYQRRLEPLYAAVRDRVGDLSGSLNNNLGGIATIKAFTAEDREVERIGEQSEAYRQANREAIRLSSAFVPIIRMAILAGFTATLLIGGFMALDGTLEVGLYSVLVFMTQRLLWPLTRLGETFDLYQRAMASTRRILDLLAVEPGVLPGTEHLPEPVAGAVRFEGVRFSYGADPVAGTDARPVDGEVLRGLDLDVPAGQTHAIIGSTGAGKSTVVKLLLRLYEPTAGRITVDGHDVAGLTFTSLRGATGFVSQDVFLFHGTVAENIGYGRPDATRAEIEQAAQLAEAHDFVALMPQGYDTVVGERGQKLSGGQRQRLSIARAILRDPAILILDEATSAVDNETEAAIQRSLDRVSQGRTTLMIAHRLSTVRNAHRIHVLEAGRVVEAGTHDELVEAGGLYAALWRVQTGDAIAHPVVD